MTEGEEHMFQGIPSFAPEIFKELISTDPLRSKQLDKGIQQLREEGIAQVFIQDRGRRKIIGAVGELQFEVIRYRLENEYGASCDLNPLPFKRACWITAETNEAMDDFLKYRHSEIVYDRDENPVYLAESEWMLNWMIEKSPQISFHFTSAFKTRSGAGQKLEAGAAGAAG